MNIGSVSRQSGIGTATLRKWEARYGFPEPVRSSSGRREYPPETVAQLRLIHRRILAGERTGTVIREWRSGVRPATLDTDAGLATGGLALARGRDPSALRHWLREQRRQTTLVDFIERIAAPMARDIGARWARGEWPVYAEHLYSEALRHVLATPSAATDAPPPGPTILLTAPAGERHDLGLRMAAAVLASEGLTPLDLPADLPNADIVAAARHYRADGVGLTASAHYPPRLLLQTLTDLRRSLPRATALWVGGAGMAALPRLPAHTTSIADMASLQRHARALAASHRAPSPPPPP